MSRENIKAHTILNARTTTGAGDGHQNSNNGTADTTYQATLDNESTTPVATVDIEVSNDNKNWVVMGTISLSGNGDTDGFAASAAWKLSRANVTAISDGGGAAAVTVTMGD